MTKEGDGSKSSYIAHIGGFFTFVALAGLSLIGWGLNYHCWSKKSCCFKEYHNPLNIRVFWWMGFMGLCGVFACCISGFVTSHNFSNKVEATRCVYERVYYDSIYGEIKINDTKWNGLKKSQGDIINKFQDFLFMNKNSYSSPFDFSAKEWIKGNTSLLLDHEVYYKKSFQDKLNDTILKKCRRFPGSLRDLSGELVCDSNLIDHNSFIYGYINEVTRITKYFSDEVVKIDDFIDQTKQKRKNIAYGKELNITNETLIEISEGLDNYKTGFLDKANYYINVSNICGYILVTIYYSILLAIVVCSCFLLWAYSYFKEQRLIYTFMHIAWNILKFFSFSFFMFGAAFGALYLISRDLIGYNQFLFSDLNLAPNVTTYLLPNGKAKEFLRYCINEEDSNYINNFGFPTIELLKDLYYNMKKGKNINEKTYNFSFLNQTKEVYYIIDENLRNIQEETDSDMPDTFILDFREVGNELTQMINEIRNTLYPNQELRILRAQSPPIIGEIEKLKAPIEKLNCG